MQGNIIKNLFEEAKENLLEAYKYTNQKEILQILKHVSHAINNTTSRELNQLIDSNHQIEKTTQSTNQIIKSLHQKAQKVEQINQKIDKVLNASTAENAANQANQAN